MDASTIRLPDGRRLAFATWGDPEAPPVLLFHGVPGSRMFRPLHDDLGVRLITVDRPGIGRSDFQPGRRIADWPADVASLLDALGVPRAGVVGVSVGAAYAAACAARIPERVTRVALVAGVGPYAEPGLRPLMSANEKRLFTAFAKLPWWVAQPMWAGMRSSLRRDADAFAERLGNGFSPTDRAALERKPALRALLVDDMREAMASGARGIAHDGWLVGQPWEFALADVKRPVDVWHGDDDGAVASAVADHVAKSIPGARRHTVAGQGHLLVDGGWGEIRDRLLA